MNNSRHPKPFDLEDRTETFARRVRELVKNLPRTMSNMEDGKQLIRASGSVGANYIEANEALSRKDFRMRVKVCRKEAKECCYWLRLVDAADKPAVDEERKHLEREAKELTNIFGSIVRKTE